MTTISFPGIGIDAFTVDSVAFTIPIFGGISIRWYAIIIMFGIILAFLYCTYRIKQERISFDDLLDMTLFGVIFGVIGARAYYVIMKWNSYDSFYDRIALWNGGLAIYGGIIAGGLTIFILCKRKKIPFLKMFDVAAPAVMIGQILGRWGNFMNGEAYGYEVSEGSPLYFLRMGLTPTKEFGYSMHYFHPTFLYESVWNLIGFIIINIVYKKKKFDGQIFFMYISWYGFGRMFIEGLRTDSLLIKGTNIRVSQWVAFLCFVAGITFLVIKLIRSKKVCTVSASTSDNPIEQEQTMESATTFAAKEADPASTEAPSSKDSIDPPTHDPN